MKPGEKLTFAPLIRVSTETQEKQGESLASQRTDLENDIKNMGGEIYKWYAGQEHATPDYERKILDELISDAQQHKFDAVIIWDLSRWSRDDVRGGQDLKILRDNGIRFFERTRERNLHDENEYFMIALYGLMGRTQALTQSRKSILNRIHRAKQGLPTCGKLPYGRTYSKEKGWGIDKEKQKIMIDVARRYLAGESLRTMAQEYGLNFSNLSKILKQRCGETWEQRFIAPRLNIDETVITVIPPLLSQAMITRISAESEGRRTYLHGQPKRAYLLGRMLFCDKCGNAIGGQASRYGKLFYRHQYRFGCKALGTIPADLIENAVMDDLFRLLGDAPGIEQAAKAAVPNLAELEALKDGIAIAEKERIKIKKSKDRFIDGLADGTISKADIKEAMTRLNERDAMLKAQIDINNIKCSSIPTKQEINRQAESLMRLRENILKSQGHLNEMSFEQKRKLLQYAFAGKDVDGKRFGVYLGKDPAGNFVYTIKGAFTDKRGIPREIDIFNRAAKINALESLENEVSKEDMLGGGHGGHRHAGGTHFYGPGHYGTETGRRSSG